MTDQTNPPGLPVLLEQLRRLRGNERVLTGDFVADDDAGFKLWEGPKGFRADSFVNQIYRRLAVKPKNES